MGRATCIHLISAKISKTWIEYPRAKESYCLIYVLWIHMHVIRFHEVFGSSVNVCTVLHRMQRTVRYNVKVICLIFKTSLTKGHIVRKCLTNVPLDGERWAKNRLVRYLVNFAVSKLSRSIKQLKTVLQNPTMYNLHILKIFYMHLIFCVLI